MIGWIIFGAVIFLFLILCLRTAYFTAKRRKLSQKILGQEEISRTYAERLAKLIRCKTIYDSDFSNAKEFEKFRENLAELFPLLTENSELKLFGGATLLYKIKGKDESRCILLLSHHDVVAAKEENWDFPPFEGVIGWNALWGRGTIDNKGTLFAILSAIEELLEKGFTPNVNLYIASSHNEEVLGDGMKMVKNWFQEKEIQPELALDEGGGAVEFSLLGKKYAFALAAVHEKGNMVLRFQADPQKAKKAFVASPTSPISRMASLINELQKDKLIHKKRLTPILKQTLDHIGPYLPLPLRFITCNLWLFAPFLKWIAPKISDEAEQLLSDTCRWRTINGGITDSSCSAELAIRIHDMEYFKKEFEHIKKIAEKYQIRVQIDKEKSEYREISEMSGKGYDYFKSTLESVFPFAAYVPFVNPAYTDARIIREICPCTYRFAPILMSIQQFNSMHNKNENICIDAIEPAIEFYKQIIENYQ